MRQRFRFEKLTVWQDARKFKQAIYSATQSFPRQELFALTSQIRRASISVSSNIAEGSGRNSDRDFAHFLEQAYGSLMETASLLFLSLDEKLIDETTCDLLLATADRLAGQIVALNRSLEVKSSKTPFPRPSASRLSGAKADSRLSTLAPRL